MMKDIYETAFSNDAFVFWMAVTLIVVVPSVSWTVADAWRKNRQAELDANLKHRMLEMGMAADEIERVVAARSTPEAAGASVNVVQNWS